MRAINVLKTGYYGSLTGNLAALLQIQAEPRDFIPLGEIEILA